MSGSVTVTPANGVAVAWSLVLEACAPASVGGSLTLVTVSDTCVFPTVVCVSLTCTVKPVVTVWPGVTWFMVGVNISARRSACAAAASAAVTW